MMVVVVAVFVDSDCATVFFFFLSVDSESGTT